MKRVIKTLVAVTLAMTMLLGTAPVSYGADPLNTKLSTYSVKENQAIFDYLDEVYTKKSPELALEPMYQSPSDEKKVKSLSTKIVGNAATRKAKFDRIVKWVEINIDYETMSDGYPMDVLYNGKANCWGYAHVITMLARSQNIPCVPAAGFLGDLSRFSYNACKDEMGHAWVYVYIDGKWRLYDPLSNVYNKTDMNFISKWYKVYHLEGVMPVYEGQNKKRANAFTDALYVNGKFMVYRDGIPASQKNGCGAESFVQVNDFCYPFRPRFNGYAIGHENNFTGWDGFDYLDEPEDPELEMSVKKSKLVNDQCFEKGWVTSGSQTRYYIRANGACLTNSFTDCHGDSYYLTYDGNGFAVADGDYTLYNGYITVPVGKTVNVFKPVWKNWQGITTDDGVIDPWHIVDDTPSTAHMTNSGAVTGKKAGLATFYIKSDYNGVGLQVSIVNKMPTIKTTSKVTGKITKSYTYDGSIKTPTVKMYNRKGDCMERHKDYTVTYADGRRSVGTYKVTVKGTDLYNFTKTYTFKINPMKTEIKSMTKGSGSFTVKWAKKTVQTTGYEIQYSTSKSFKHAKKVAVKSSKTTSKTIKSLKSNKKYYVRVRTYKVVDGKKYYSKWSPKKYITTK